MYMVTFLLKLECETDVCNIIYAFFFFYHLKKVQKGYGIVLTKTCIINGKFLHEPDLQPYL